jgi:hypothetical protein
MDKQKINFYCPSATVEVIDEMAANDHRDRTSMLNKIVDDYIKAHYQPTNGTKPTTVTKKKAGAR